MATLPAHFIVPTRRVCAPGGGFIVINAADFDPAKHKEWGGPEPPPPQPIKPGFSIEELGLSAGALRALEAKGLTTAEGILAAAENPEWFEDVTGIGRTSAGRLVEAAREHLES